VSEQGRDVLGLDGGNADVLLVLAKELADALERASAADARHETRDVARHLVPQLTGRLLVMGTRVVRVLELLRHEDARVLVGHFAGVADGALDALVVRGQHQVGPERLDEFLALLAHPLGHDDANLVAFEAADEGHADARVPGGGLEEDGVGVEFSVAFGAFDHRQGHAVLDAAARIQELGLQEDEFVLQPDDRRVADEVQDIVRQHGAPWADCRCRTVV